MAIQKDFRLYKDLDISFSLHPVSKDVGRVTGDNSIRQSIWNILMTEKFEVPFNPEFSSGIKKYLFDPVSPITALALQTDIKMALDNYEPRISVNSVSVGVINDGMDNKYIVEVKYNFVNLPVENTVSFYLNRVR